MINETIQSLRRQRNITQDVLAQALGISVQAVSKWETGNSLPDIMLLPDIARFFGVSIDYLFHQENNEKQPSLSIDFNDDNKLRILQFIGRHMVDAQEYKEDCYIPIAIDPDKYKDVTIAVEIRGNADIKGNVNGGVSAGSYVECANVSGGINAGTYVQSGNISGGLNAGAYVQCGNVSGGINAGANIECGNISGGASSFGSIECGNIIGNVSCQGDLNADNIEGDVEVKSGNITCDSIKNVTFCAGTIQCNDRMN
jgi:transcriptional regulator with XRE-family HTH domain